MALEEAVNTLTAAVLKLTERIEKGGAPAPAAATAAVRGPGRPRKIGIDEVKAVARKVRDEKGAPLYKNFLNQFDATQLAEVAETKYPEFIAAAEVLLASKEPEPAEASDDL